MGCQAIKIQRKLKCMILSEEVNLKGCLLYDSNYMTFWEKKNYKDSENQ